MEELQSTKDEYSLVYQFWHLLKQNLLSYVDFFWPLSYNFQT